MTVASNRQRAEFTDNLVVHFRGRIPGGLDLRRGDWEVGLTSFLLPVPLFVERTIYDYLNACVYGYQFGPRSGVGPYTRKKIKIPKFPAGQTWMQNVTIKGKTVQKKDAITFRWEV